MITLIISLIKKLLKLSVMNNIPNLGDFGYIPKPTSNKGISWLSIIVLAAIGVVAVFVVYKFLQSITTNHEYSKIVYALENSNRSNEFLE